MLLAQAIQKGNNLGHHLIQSFAPGEATPEQAHEIGRRLADEILQGKYPYVLTTHIDKGHVHASGVRDVVGDLAAEIADLKTEISELEAEIARSEASILAYIVTIKDARTRTIFRLRFIRGMAWKEVAATIGWISESGVKAIYDRYIARGGPARMGRPPKKRD